MEVKEDHFLHKKIKNLLKWLLSCVIGATINTQSPLKV
jgi:hypothetical protein